MKTLTIRIGDTIRSITQERYDNIIAYTTRINEKGEPEVNWPLALEIMERKSSTIGPISDEQKEEENEQF